MFHATFGTYLMCYYPPPDWVAQYRRYAESHGVASIEDFLRKRAKANRADDWDDWAEWLMWSQYLIDYAIREIDAGEVEEALRAHYRKIAGDGIKL